jgi:hypothetical protein
MNHTTAACVFNKAVQILWQNGVKPDNALLLFTVAAPYTTKAAEGL